MHMGMEEETSLVFVKTALEPSCLAAQLADPAVLHNAWISEIDSTIHRISSVVPDLIERVLQKETKRQGAPYFVVRLTQEELSAIEAQILSEYGTFWIETRGSTDTSTIGNPAKRRY